MSILQFITSKFSDEFTWNIWLRAIRFYLLLFFHLPNCLHAFISFGARNVRNLQKLQEFWPSVLIFFFLNKTNISHNLRYNYIERSSSKPKLTWHWFSVILRKMGRGDAWSKGNKSEVLYSLNKPRAAWSNGNKSTDSVV